MKYTAQTINGNKHVYDENYNLVAVLKPGEYYPGLEPDTIASNASNNPGTISKGPPPQGVKYDQDKPDMSLLSSTAIVKIAQVMTFGKKKYAANNWRGGFAWSRPLAASLRHIFAYIGGEDKDPETGISHLAHAACCLMFVLEFEETHRNLDDRYKKDEACK